VVPLGRFWGDFRWSCCAAGRHNALYFDYLEAAGAGSLDMAGYDQSEGIGDCRFRAHYAGLILDPAPDLLKY